jgi:site-specific recombinase XerD
VQELMRHSSPTTTAVYTAVGHDELRAVIDLL